jgi:hypothetical protein
MHDLIKQHLSRAQVRMKQQADKHRSERQFAVGDKVFVKLQPYVQSSLAPRANQKLAFKFFGPYTILARVGSVAYKLALPPSSSIHPVFHVSQLKKCNTEVCQDSSPLPSDVDLPRVPERVLQSKLVSRGDRSVQQLLIKWSDWPEDLATWEDMEGIKQRFPDAPAWGQAGFQEHPALLISWAAYQHQAQAPKQKANRLRMDHVSWCVCYSGRSPCNRLFMLS